MAHLFYQNATAYSKGRAPSSEEEMPTGPGLCTTLTLCTSYQPWAFLWKTQQHLKKNRKTGNYKIWAFV